MTTPGIDPHVFPLMPPKSIEHRLAHFTFDDGKTSGLALGRRSRIDGLSVRLAWYPIGCSLGCTHDGSGSESSVCCDDDRFGPYRPDSHLSFPIVSSTVDCSSGHRHSAGRRPLQVEALRTPLARGDVSVSSCTPAGRESLRDSHRSLSPLGLVPSPGISSERG